MTKTFLSEVLIEVPIFAVVASAAAVAVAAVVVAVVIVAVVIDVVVATVVVVAAALTAYHLVFVFKYVLSVMVLSCAMVVVVGLPMMFLLLVK